MDKMRRICTIEFDEYNKRIATQSIIEKSHYILAEECKSLCESEDKKFRVKGYI